MVAPALIGAGIGAIVPLITEIMRTKPDPEVAKQAIMSKRQEMIERAIGAGATPIGAEKSVDAQIAQEVAAAEAAGEFNMPIGEMIMGAGLGAVAPAAFGKLKGLLGGAKAAAPAAAAPVAAAAGPTASDVAMAMSGGIPLTRGKAVVTKGGGDVAEMMVGGPFPAEAANLPLSIGKAVRPPKMSNVDMAAMMGGGPFPG